MIETEVKILEINKKKVVRQLIVLGAKKIFSGKIETARYDHIDQRLSKSGLMLRLRTRGRFIELTLKKRISTNKTKVALEHEIMIDDYKKGKEILGLLGLKQFNLIHKYRESYSLSDAHFEFDKMEGIPEFMEIEAKEKVINKYVGLLGLDKTKIKPWSMRDVEKHYKKHKI